MTSRFFLATFHLSDSVGLSAVKQSNRRGAAAYLQVLHPALDLGAPMRRLARSSARMLDYFHFKHASRILRHAG